MATKLGFQALNLAFCTFSPLDFVTRILFQKYLFRYVTDSLDCIHDIHCCPLSEAFEYQHFCTDFSFEELLLAAGRVLSWWVKGELSLDVARKILGSLLKILSFCAYFNTGCHVLKIWDPIWEYLCYYFFTIPTFWAEKLKRMLRL